MSFFGKSCAITRFAAVGAYQGSLFDGMFLQQLRAGAFEDIDDQPGREISRGWCDSGNMLTATFDEVTLTSGLMNVAVFSFRMDKRAVSPAVLKKHLAIAVRNALAEQDSPFLSRERKKELKAQVKLRLQAKAMPVPRVFDVVWDTESGEVWLSSTASAVVESLVSQFLLSFAIPLSPLAPLALAMRKAPELSDALNALQPEGLFGPCGSCAPEGFLGGEFLIWLWYRCREGLPEGAGELYFCHEVACRAGGDDKASMTGRGVSGGTAAARAILEGQRPVRLKFAYTAKNGDDYVFTLTDALGVQLTPPPVPPAEEDDDPRAVELEKISLLKQFCEWLDAMYVQFLQLRTGAGWHLEALAMQLWLELVGRGQTENVEPFAENLANRLQGMADKHDCTLEVECKGTKARVTPKKADGTVRAIVKRLDNELKQEGTTMTVEHEGKVVATLGKGAKKAKGKAV